MKKKYIELDDNILCGLTGKLPHLADEKLTLHGCKYFKSFIIL